MDKDDKVNLVLLLIGVTSFLILIALVLDADKHTKEYELKKYEILTAKCT